MMMSLGLATLTNTLTHTNQNFTNDKTKRD